MPVRNPFIDDEAQEHDSDAEETGESLLVMVFVQKGC